MHKPLFFALLALALLSCGLWQPYAAMQAPAATVETHSTWNEFTPSPTPQHCTVTAETLNLRAGPGTSYQVKAWLFAGDLLTITQDGGGWLQVIDPSGAAGWVNSMYCKIGE